METLKNIITNFNPVDENEEGIKEALSILLDFSDLKIKTLEKEIEKNLISGTFIGSNFKVPVSNIISKISVQGARNVENEHIFIDDVIASLSEILKCSEDIAFSITKEIERNLTALIEENDKEVIFSFLAPEGTSIIRYDLIFCNKNLNSKKIREKILSSLSYVAVKSVVNIRNLAFNEFLSLYSDLLKKYFGEDNDKVKYNLAEMRDIYSICLSE